MVKRFLRKRVGINDLTTEDIPSEKNKIALCIPNRGGTEVTLEWALYTLKLLRLPVGSKILTQRGSPIDVARNNLVKKAIEVGFDYIGFLDIDVACEPDAFIKLLAHNKPFVAGVYRTKRNQLYKGKMLWNAYAYVDDPKGYFPIGEFDTDGLNEVGIVAAGLSLIEVGVFEKIDYPWFEWDRKGGHGYGEDFNFCIKLKDAGIPVLVDSTIQAPHICGEMKILNDGSIELLRV